MPEMNGWSAYEKLVLDKLEVLGGRLDDVEAQVVLVRIDVAKLKVQASLWGAAAGFIPALIGVAAVLLGGGNA